MRGREIVPFPIPSSNLVTEDQLQMKLVTVHKWRGGNLLTRNFTCRWKQGKLERKKKMWVVHLKQLEGASMCFAALRAISLRCFH